eukprot:gene6032-6483_t
MRSSSQLTSKQTLSLVFSTVSGVNSRIYCILEYPEMLLLTSRRVSSVSRFRGFDAEINDFAEPFPSFLCLLINITGLSLGTNRFTGTIPECITNLTLLTRVLLSRNDFFGLLPQDLDN